MRFLKLARSRALLPLALFAPIVYSRENVIFTSSVTYCEPPETLLIQHFDVIYFASNQSVHFNISAASVQPNVNVTANLFLNVYGLHPINYTINLCNILDGALCPLPMYNFTGADTLSLPKSFGVAGRIPQIAFDIPDLESFAQLTLSEVGNGNVKACIQATLSNGWSTHQRSVEWVTGAFAIVAMLSAIWQSWSPDAAAPLLLLELFYLYQTIASTALLDLNYPSVYRAYALNFAWAMGLLPSTHIQDSINRMRHLTGGTLADSSPGSAVGLVNRKQSPYNAETGLTAQAGDSTLQFVNRLFQKRMSDQGAVQTVTADSSNVLQAGLPIYVNTLHIATANTFMTLFFVVLMLSMIAVTAFVFIYAVLSVIATRQNSKKTSLWRQMLKVYPNYVKAWILRLGLIVFIPSLTFIFYQWTLQDSWLSVLLSIFTFIAILGLVGYSAFSILRFAYVFSPDWIYSQKDIIGMHGPLYARYRVPRFYFFVPTILAVVLKSILVAFAKANGVAQMTGMVIIEGLSMLSLCVLRPFGTRHGNIFSIFLAVVRLVCSGLLISFLEELNVNAIKRVIVGFIIIVIFSIAVLVTFGRVITELLFGKFGLSFSKGLTSSFPSGPQDSEWGIMEKDETNSSGSWDREQAIGRPVNPTPDRGLPCDEGFLQPHDFSTSVSPVPSTGLDSSRDSGTMTLGSLLSRRWSFSLSAPGSPTSSSALHQSGLQTMSDFSSSHAAVTPVSLGTDGHESEHF
ncbi:hypothetical protein APHAL10511_000192 [Amanita phalloides]|nr:hypothetical protein APHAL10511_000192 [Amanita phalloides]